MATTKCIKACKRGEEVQMFFRPNVRMGKKSDLSHFDHGMIVGDRGISQKLLISWDSPLFHIFFLFSCFSPNLVANCTLSIPIARVLARDTLPTPRPSAPRWILRMTHHLARDREYNAIRACGNPSNPCRVLPPPSERRANYAAPCEPAKLSFGMAGKISWDFPRTTVLRVYREWCSPVCSSSVGRNALLMREVRGEGPDWSNLTGRWQ